MRQSWKETFEMPAEEFLGMLAYIKEKRRKEKEEINRLKMTKTY